MTPTWLLLEVTAILVLALVGTRLARKSPAAVRHVALSAAFAALLILPFASMVAPSIRVEVPAAVHAAIAPLDVDAEPIAVIPSAATSAPVVSTPVGAPESVGWSWPSLPTLLLGGWIFGAVLFLLPVGVGLWQVRSLRRSGLPWRRGGVAAGVLAGEAGIHRGVDVLLHESVPGPMTCGVVHPAIVLPKDAEGWAPEDLSRAIVHELEHVRRVDWISHCLARVVAACYWFHPFVWVAWRQLVLEAERACDDAVLRRSEAADYADQLVVLAQRLSAASNQPLLAMANRRDLNTRVMAVLDNRQRRGRAGTVAVAMAAVACALLVMTMSPLRIVSASAAHASQEKFEAVLIKSCPALPPPGTGRGQNPRFPSTSPGYANWGCVSLAELVNQAYAGEDYPLLNTANRRNPDYEKVIRGGPSWAYSERFSVEVRAKGGSERAALTGPLLRAMLEDRFQLKLRHATEQQTMYGLTVAKSGLKLARTPPEDCWVRPQGATPATPAPPGFEGKHSCGTMHGEFPNGNVKVDMTGMTLAGFANYLSGFLDHYVLDQTGVDGMFNIPLEYAPDEHTREAGHTRPKSAGGTPDPTPEPSRSGGPSIFKALESLGLKLEGTKGTAEYLVIESVQRPRPDSPAFAADSSEMSGNTPDGSSPNQSQTATNQQSAAATGPVKFDVVSIKPCAGLPPAEAGRGDATRSAQVSPGYVRWSCVTLSQLINQAYAGAESPLLNILAVNRARDDSPKRVRGGPSWVDTDPFVVEAKSASIVTPDGGVRAGNLTGPSLGMLRALLEDRFQLKLRRAMEQQPMYALTLATGGLKLTPTGPGDCWVRSLGTTLLTAEAPPGFEGKRPCGTASGFTRNGNQFVETSGLTLKGFAGFLSGVMDRYVLDQTAVDGMFNFPFEYAADDHTPGVSSPKRPAPGTAGTALEPAPGGSGPTIFKALEALGLHLEPTKGPAEYLLIESVQKPRPDSPSDPPARAAGSGIRR